MIDLERLPRPLLAFGVPLLFFAIALCIMPIAEVLQFDPDEGIELAKVTLYRQGYTLYDQIWNDQPPLLTILLAQWLGFWGHSIIAARLLILSFAALLVGAFYSTLRLTVRQPYALAGTFGLCLTFGFLQLSVSVMRGLPALALAMLAVYWLCLGMSGEPSGGQTEQSLWQRSWRCGWIMASGVCFGLSLQIKFVTLLLAPACLGQLFNQGTTKGDRPAILVTLWSIFCGLSFLVTGLLTDAFHPSQLLETHLNAATQTTLQQEPSWLRLLMFLAEDLDYSILAAIGVWLLLRRNLSRHNPAFPLYWLLTALAILSFHQPLWDHYSLFVAIPVVWLATYTLAYIAQVWPSKKRWKRPIFRKILAALVIFAIALIPVKLGVNVVINQQLTQASHQQFLVIAALLKYQAQTRWLFTDLPIASFYANLKVPPELAVFSTKRIESGSLSNDKLLTLLQTYQPEQVLLGRYPNIQAALQPYLAAHYVRQYKQAQISLYVIRSLIETQSPIIPAISATHFSNSTFKQP